MIPQFQSISRTKHTVGERNCDTRTLDRNNLTFADFCTQSILDVDGLADPRISRTRIWLGPIKLIGTCYACNIIARQTVGGLDTDRITSTNRTRFHNEAKTRPANASNNTAASHISSTVDDRDFATNHRARICLVVAIIADLNRAKINFEAEGSQNWISCSLIGRSKRAESNGI